MTANELIEVTTSISIYTNKLILIIHYSIIYNVLIMVIGQLLEKYLESIWKHIKSSIVQFLFCTKGFKNVIPIIKISVLFSCFSEGVTHGISFYKCLYTLS